MVPKLPEFFRRILESSLSPAFKGLLLTRLGFTTLGAASFFASFQTCDAQNQEPVLSAAHSPFINFESGPVHPLILSADGLTLYALNTPDHRVEIYEPWNRISTTQGSPAHRSSKSSPRLELRYVASVFVGLEPVSMALHPMIQNRLFVSNHLSDSVSVINTDTRQVSAVLQVGDEPRGLLVANDKLFVACSRAPLSTLQPGQVDPGEFEQNTVVVFQASSPYERLALISLEALVPRDLVAVDDRVYVIPLNSSNNTTLLNETFAEDLGIKQEDADGWDGAFDINPILLRPEINTKALARGWYIPDAGRIVYDWEFPNHTPQLPDNDILSINLSSLELEPETTHDVGTTLFSIRQNPHTGRLWVLNQESNNRTRFERLLEGIAVSNRITVSAPGGAVETILDLSPPFTSQAHAQPVALEFSKRADTPYAYVATIGTSTLLVIDATDQTVVDEIPVDFMPTGIAIDDARKIVYVAARGAKTIRAYDMENDHTQVGPTRSLGYDPEPVIVSRGRQHLYEARESSGHGNGSLSCASCHIFGHHDQTAWDLGDPEGGFGYHYPDIMTDVAGFEGEVVALPTVPILSPFKGPMVTQSFRGLTDPETRDDVPLHWRGDRRVFQTFQGAFVSLLGGTGISREDMQDFSGFLRTLRYSPNPYQDKDRAYRGESFEGMNKFGMNDEFIGKEYNHGAQIFCVSCHKGNFMAGTDYTGSRPTVSAGAFEQVFNTAQLRQSYEKDFRHLSGYGVLHDGAVDGVRGFLDFTKPDRGTEVFPAHTQEDRDQIAAFVRRWDSGLAPLVGYQFALNQSTILQANDFFDSAEAQAELQMIDLILKGFRYTAEGKRLNRGAWYSFDSGSQSWSYLFDTNDRVNRSTLLTLAIQGAAEFVFTCVPHAQGERLGIDRDEDGLYDSLEVIAHTSESNPDSDGDGYTDGREIALGSNPHQPNATLLDTTPPTVLLIGEREVFNRAATLEVWGDEPVKVTARFGIAQGDSSLGIVLSQELRQQHDLITTTLTPDTEVHYEAVLVDRNGNQTVAFGTFRTMPPFLHVGDIVMFISGTGPYLVDAHVLVHDDLGQPVDDVPIRGFFAGDIGGQPFSREARTGPDGWATFTLSPFTPSSSTRVSFSPAYIGSLIETDPYFVGLGGDTPAFFYEQAKNRINYQFIDIP